MYGLVLYWLYLAKLIRINLVIKVGEQGWTLSELVAAGDLPVRGEAQPNRN